ncbi:MAG: MBL fold metallo-hydrolase [Dehalococcoidia bacterium]|nr:MBL fold metallo-hydrolase [Dehalococcoidia bacterium]
MNGPIQFRWLGVAGIELSVNGQVLVIDPYFTRIPFWRAWFGRVEPDRGLIAQKVRTCDFVLVTHAHFDHLMDVPEVVLNTDASALGSPNTCRLLRACGVPDRRIREIGPGANLALKDFQVEVFSAKHMKTPGFSPGPLRPDLRAPLNARDYRMDDDYSFLIHINGRRILTDPGEQPQQTFPADILFLYAHREDAYYRWLLPLVRPSVVVPIHWDDFFRPLTQPLKAHYHLPRLAFPPLQRVGLRRFEQVVGQAVPGVTVFLPEIFQIYDLTALPGVDPGE